MRTRMFFGWGLTAVAAGAIFAGCGGGGHSIVPSGQPAPVAKQPAGGKTQGVTIRIEVPPKGATSGRLHTAYISPNTTSLNIIVVASPYPSLAPIAIQIAACTPSTTYPSFTDGQCTASVVMYTGSAAAPVTNMVTVQALGSTGTVLSQATEPVSLPQAIPAAIGFSLGGVVNGITLALTYIDTTGATDSDGYVPVGTSSALSVNAVDPSGYTIVGTFSTPITLSSLPTGLAYSSASLASTSVSPVTITYTGGPVFATVPADTTILATVQGSTASAQVAFNPTSAIIDYVIPTPAAGTFTAQAPLVVDGNNNFFIAGANAILGFKESNPTATPIVNSLAYTPGSIAVDNGSDLWVTNPAASQLQCYSTPMSVGAATSTTAVPGPTGTPSPRPDTLAFDKQNYVWMTDLNNPTALYDGLTSGCTVSGLQDPVAAFAINGEPIVADPTSGVWIGSSSYNDSLVYANPTTSPAAVSFGTGAFGVMGLATGTAHVSAVLADFGTGVFALGNTTSNSPAAFSASTTTIAGLAPGGGALAQMASNRSGSQSDVLFDSGGPFLVGLLNNTSPPTVTGWVGLPAAPGAVMLYPVGMAVDSNGSAWVVAQAGSGGVLVSEHVVPTANWSLFPDTSTFAFDYGAYAGIIGGSATDTFALVQCTGEISCTPGSQVAPRLFSLGCTSGTGDYGTVEVEDSSSPPIERTFNVYVPDCSTT